MHLAHQCPIAEFTVVQKLNQGERKKRAVYRFFLVRLRRILFGVCPAELRDQDKKVNYRIAFVQQICGLSLLFFDFIYFNLHKGLKNFLLKT